MSKIKKSVCTRCGSGGRIHTSSVATTPDLETVRIMVILCFSCRRDAEAENQAADARRGGIITVLEVEHIWSLPEAEEPHYVCRQCHNEIDTPVHFFDCERGGKRSWP